MKNAFIAKLVIFSALMLMFDSSMAGTCNKGSLSGNYNFIVMGSTSGDSEHIVGRITFNGTGSATASGIDTYNGVSSALSGSGTYSVNSACIATGTITWSIGLKTTYWLYLDQMDMAPSTAVAYHGSFALKNNNGFSASGELNRVTGKF